MAKPKIDSDKDFELRLTEKRNKELITVLTNILDKISASPSVDSTKELSLMVEESQKMSKGIAELGKILGTSKESKKKRWVFTIDYDSQGIATQIIAEQD